MRSVRLQDGSEDGVRALDVRVMAGLSLLVLCDRGMDLGPAWYRGVPVHWASPTGVVHPSFTQDHDWLRSFHGGLMVTAGLQNVGPGCREGDETHPMHGRLSSTPARNVCWRVHHHGDVPYVEITGDVRETTVYGADLLLRRTLRLTVGSPVLELHDEVVNQGWADAPLMLLYHFNIGHPTVAEGAQLVAPSAEVVARDEASQRALEDHAGVHEPRLGADAQVFEHRVAQGGDRSVSVCVVNEAWAPTDGVGVAVRYRPDQLPRLWQWRMLAPGMYLTGLEPANCGVRGRAAERADGDVDVLAPGDRRRFDLQVEVAHGQEALNTMIKESQGA